MARLQSPGSDGSRVPICRLPIAPGLDQSAFRNPKSAIARVLARVETHNLYSKSLAEGRAHDQTKERRPRLQPAIHEGKLDGRGFRFAIVASRWNDFISSRLVDGALDALERLGAEENRVDLFRVPGAFEIPLLALRLAESEKFDAVICLGTIIRGQTPHFEYIAGEVTRGIGEAALQTGVPVVFGVVTADTVDQAIDRAGVKLGNKGFEAATTAVELANLYKTVNGGK